jgi:hypothetical protein
MLKNEFAEAEKQFRLAPDKGQNFNGNFNARFGLMRARIKQGKTVEVYRELGANPQAFQEVAGQCFTLKDGAELERVLAAHRQAFPAVKGLTSWDVEAAWLKKDYAAVVKMVESDRAGTIKHSLHNWKCEGYYIRSLVRLKRSADAVREAELLNKRKYGPHVLLALALASTGDVPRVLAYFDGKQKYVVENCYYDEELGPLLRSAAFRAVQDRYPPPPERVLPGGRFDDWD